MRLSARWLLVTALLFSASLVPAGPTGERPTPRTNEEAPVGPPKPPPTLEELPLPSDTVVVVCEKVAQALEMIPEGILLSPQQYQELLRLRNRVRELEARARALNVFPPSECHLTGQVIGDQAFLKARFEFATTRDDEVVPLACGGAIPTDVSLSTTLIPEGGENRKTVQTFPLLREGAAGLLVQVGPAGDQELTLEMVLPLSARPEMRGAPDRQVLLLSLPGSPITSLRLTLPEDARDVQLAKTPLAETVLTQKGATVSGPLRRTDKLELTWEQTTDSPHPSRTVDGLVLVRLDALATVTETTLTLRARQATDSWDLLLPPRAEVRAAPADAGRVRIIRKKEAPGQALSKGERWEVRLRTPETGPLTLQVRTQRSRPKPGTTIPVGPFEVSGAVRQTGEILVVNRTPNLYLDFRPRRDPWAWGPEGGQWGGLTRLSVTGQHRRLAAEGLHARVLQPAGDAGGPDPDPGKEGAETDVVAAFRYAWLDAEGNPKAEPDPEPWLEIEGDLFRGRLQTQTRHEATLLKASEPARGRQAETGGPDLLWGERNNEEGEAGKDEDKVTPAPPAVWRITTTIQITAPAGPSADVIEVALPPGYVPDEPSAVSNPAGLLRDWSVDGEAGLLQLRLRPAKGGTSPREFTLTWSGRLTVADRIATGKEAPSRKEDGSPPGHPPVGDPPSGDRTWTLPLPVPRGTIDQGSTLTVQVPPEQELIHLASANPTLELTRRPAGPEALASWNRLTWQAPPGGSPDRIVVAWRPYLPEVNADATVDIDLLPHQARVRQRFSFRFDQPAPAQVALRIPEALPDRLRIQGGELLPSPTPPDTLPLPGEAPGKRTEPDPDQPQALATRRVTRGVRLLARAGNEHILTLEYTFPIHTGSIPIPLVFPTGVTRGEQKIRVWEESSLSPEVALVPSADDPWVTRNVEAVPGRDRLPVLVLWTRRLDAALHLRREGPPGPTAAESWVVWPTRALIRVGLRPDGSQDWMARFVLARLNSEVDVDLPAPPEGINLKVVLDGKVISALTVPEGDRKAAGGNDRPDRANPTYRVRLRVDPELAREGSLLEISYRLLPGHVSSQSLTDVLRPPRLVGQPREDALPVCWEVSLPSGRIVLSPEQGRSVPLVWGWRGWLWAPRPSPGVRDDLQAWLGTASTEPPGEQGPPDLVCWSHGAEPLTLAHTNERAWLLCCSVGLLLVGLGLGVLAQPRASIATAPDNRPRGQENTAAVPTIGWAAFWVTAALMALLAGAIGVLRPALLGQVLYGCQPGVIVLLGVGFVQWFVLRRRRKRMLVLPSFRRPTGRSTFPADPLPESTGSWARPSSPSAHAEPLANGSSGARRSKVERTPDPVSSGEEPAPEG